MFSDTNNIMLSSEKPHTCKTFSYIKDEEHLLTYLKARCKIVLNSEKLYEKYIEREEKGKTYRSKQEWRQRKNDKNRSKKYGTQKE